MKTKGWMGTVALAALLGATGCSKNEGDGGGGGGSDKPRAEKRQNNRPARNGNNDTSAGNSAMGDALAAAFGKRK